ncbi:MAG: binding--dependent transport system inner rane component family protein [Glaciihabitans sp.]|nr:binding--dependent transport system inner rane component family protein [Glaciihabitans sp.]
MTGTAIATVSERRASAVRTGVVIVLVLLAWELLGRFRLIGDGAFPPISDILASWWDNRDIYPAHILSTVGTAGAGFVIGNVVAILLAGLFVLLPAAEKLLRPLVVVLFCLPVVVVAPILGVAFDGDWPKISLAILLVFFPTMIATVVGLTNAPRDAMNVVFASGGGPLRVLLLVRLRAALPDLLSGLQISAPAAFLGAILGEFLGGREGLGVYLIGSMGRGEPAILWAIGLVATILSAAVYGAIGLLRRALGAENTRPSADMSSLRSIAPAKGAAHRGVIAAAWLIGGILVLLGAWFAFIAATGLPRTLMNSPVEVWRALFVSPSAAETRATIGDALASSLLPALIGTAAGILLALVLAVALSTSPAVARAFMPFAFVSQTVPLVALAPLIALVMGRGLPTIIAVTVSVTFFPSLVTMIQGIANAPTGPLDVMRSVNASRASILVNVIIPNAVPHLLASVRLAVPRALTGVLIAEQYITGTGLGGLLGISRGYLDYRMMWVIATVVAIISFAVYAIAQAAENTILARRA